MKFSAQGSAQWVFWGRLVVPRRFDLHVYIPSQSILPFGLPIARLITMDIEMKPRAVLVRVRRTVKEHDFALIPTLVRLADVSEIERGETVWWIRGHSTHAALVALTAVCRVAVVPDVDRYLQSLKQIQPKDNVKNALKSDGAPHLAANRPSQAIQRHIHCHRPQARTQSRITTRTFCVCQDRKVWGNASFSRFTFLNSLNLNWICNLRDLNNS